MQASEDKTQTGLCHSRPTAVCARYERPGEVARRKRSRELKLTVRRGSSNKDRNSDQLRRVLDEDAEVPARLRAGVLSVRTAVQSKWNYGVAGYSATSRRSFAGNPRGEYRAWREDYFCVRENRGGL